MTSELRPASEVWSIACGAYEDATADLLDLPMRDMVVAGDEAAAAVIEADREAVRAEQAAELAKFKALAETLAGALEAIRSEAQRKEGSWLHLKRCIAAQSAEALREYKEARDAS